jgi:hypothetical protein
MTTTPDFRELCAELVNRLDELNCNFDIPSQSALIEYALDALATPPPEPPTELPVLPPGYIDFEHTGQDREILDAFYRACNSEGGTADEIHLRGIRAVLEKWG